MNDEEKTNDIETESQQEETTPEPPPPSITITFNVGGGFQLHVDPRVSILQVFGAAKILEEAGLDVLNQQKMAAMQAQMDRAAVMSSLRGHRGH